MDRLVAITKEDDISPEYRQTPIGDLLKYHNLGQPLGQYSKAELLIGMCMDHRKRLRIPENFAYIIRSGGANLRFSEFTVSYATAVGDIGHIALIGHTNCGMVNLAARKEPFVEGLVEKAGWEEGIAKDHFNHLAPLFEIGNEVEFVLHEVPRLRQRYPKIKVAPMLYKVEDNQLYLIKED